MKNKPSSKQKVRKVKAYAIADSEILKKDGVVFGKIFNANLSLFSEAIFLDKKTAQIYAARMSRSYKTQVIPVTLSYLQ